MESFDGWASDEEKSNFDDVLHDLIEDLYKQHKPINIDEFLNKEEDNIKDLGIF